MWDEMSITQDIKFDINSFEYKVFTFLYESPSASEEDEANSSALNEEWTENDVGTAESLNSTTEIPDLADHALVLIFRPYKASWIQPIVAFASMNAASGAQLQKIVLKAMILLEDADARVFSTVCDGSQPKNSMWNLFGISRCNSDTVSMKNSIIHPTAGSDVYFLRDLLHLYKCIINHIFNHKDVQVLLFLNTFTLIVL